MAKAMFFFHVELLPLIEPSSKPKSGWRKKPYLYKTTSIQIRAARTPRYSKMQGPNPSKISRPGSLSSPFPFGHLPYFNLLQHYMVNLSINEQLASVARVKDGECVIEIGPGTGALTQVLDAGATVLAVEKVRQQSRFWKRTSQSVTFVPI